MNWNADYLEKHLPTPRTDGESASDMATVKLFTPDAGCTWKLSEYDPDSGLAFGYCDLGMGPYCSELGYVSIPELLERRGALGLPVERDLYYTPELISELAGF